MYVAVVTLTLSVYAMSGQLPIAVARPGDVLKVKSVCVEQLT